MKSKKAKQYLFKVVAPIAMMYPEHPEYCDLTLGEAKQAVELAEQEMINQALKAYCFCRCGVASCIMKQVGRDDCKELREFKQKLTDDEND